MPKKLPPNVKSMPPRGVPSFCDLQMFLQLPFQQNGLGERRGKVSGGSREALILPSQGEGRGVPSWAHGTYNGLYGASGSMGERGGLLRDTREGQAGRWWVTLTSSVLPPCSCRAFCRSSTWARSSDSCCWFSLRGWGPLSACAHFWPPLSLLCAGRSPGAHRCCVSNPWRARLASSRWRCSSSCRSRSAASCLHSRLFSS